MAAHLPEADFIRLFEEIGPTRLSERIGVSERNVHKRRENLEKKIGRQITGPEYRSRTRSHVAYEGRIDLKIKDGTVIVGGDAHFWPDIVSTAWRAFVKFAKDLKPAAVIVNGDILDGASISRHAPIGWEKRPSLIQEIETCQRRLGELEKVSEKARRVWCLGNHDARFATRLATVAPEYARVKGVSLNDHFPEWESAWGVWINNHTVVKHRYKGGVHARHNNTVNAGLNIVTNHLHNLGVTAFSDYRGTRFGVDTGTLACPDGPQFLDYTEAGPKNWRSGFSVLTFSDYELLWPEVVHVRDEDLGIIEFRGKTIKL